MRLATANTYDSTVSNIQNTAGKLSQQQNMISSGLRVTKASDDPAGAARAEQSLSRLSQLNAQQRALNMQIDSVTSAETSLNSGVGLVQDFRTLVVQAANATNTASDRATIAVQLTDIRQQLLNLANTQDSNGNYLFSGTAATTSLGAATTPFNNVSGGPPNVQYTGNTGQNSPTQSGIPFTMDGSAAFMSVPKGNGIYSVTPTATNQGQISTDIGQFTPATALSGLSASYTVTFSIIGNTTSYSVNTVPTATTGTYVQGQAIAFADGASSVSMTVYGTPAAGDTLTIAPYAGANASTPATTSIFDVMDKMVSDLQSTSSGKGAFAQNMAQGLIQLDAGGLKLQTAQGQTGAWLALSDSLTAANTGKSTQLKTDLSNAQDLDMVEGLAHEQQLQTGFQAALQSYAQIQKLSLFNYIS